MQIVHLIDLALREDIGSGDITTDAIFGGKQEIVTANVIAKQAGIVCGVDFLIDTYKHLDPKIKVKIHKSNGYDVVAGER